MVNYGPADNQKFAILIKPENYDLITFFYSSEGKRPDWMETGEEDGNYYTYTISKRYQQSVANYKIETPQEIRAPWNKLNPPERKIAFVTTAESP
jgi:hypothetical protein